MNDLVAVTEVIYKFEIKLYKLHVHVLCGEQQWRCVKILKLPW